MFTGFNGAISPPYKPKAGGAFKRPLLSFAPGFALISAGECALLGPEIDTAYLHVNPWVIKIRIWPFKFNTLLYAFISAFLKVISKNNKLQT